MKDKAILFSTEMVRAILDGRKTQTRRIVRPQPKLVNDWWKWKDCEWHHTYVPPMKPDYVPYKQCPYQPGQLLYVRETWDAPARMVGCADPDITGIVPDLDRVVYKADDAEPFSRWRPSIHMPKKASRIWLRVVKIRMERIKEITEQDAKAEGVDPIEWGEDHGGLVGDFSSHAAAFIDLWDSLNESRGYGWKADPWVWVVDFEVVSTAGKPKNLLIQRGKK